MTDTSDHLIETIRESVIGDDFAVAGPFGERRYTYADYTASGRSLSFVEDFIRQHVMPLYANTHTETSGTGLQTSHFREEARRIIRDHVGANEEDVVIFAGSGATGAIAKLIGVLNLCLPYDLDERYGLSSHIPAQERPVVFIGPYEHHSNELPWRESIADVVVIDEDKDGKIDVAQLERELQRHSARPLLIGSFSAASNVTGVESDVVLVSHLLHAHGALSFWDFAAAGPYVAIDMNPEHDPLAYMDAIFLSPHKFPGGPGTPGVLVAKRALFKNTVPTVPGGGTVAYVSSANQDYLADPEQREEGGTPAIIGSIRAGLVFQLKQAIGAERIQRIERDLVRRAVDAWEAHPNLRVLGSRTAPRLSIVSFIVRHGEGFLHHNFVVALLNDLFGVQARGGCSCAGPYGHRLLNIDATTSEQFEKEVLLGCEGIKPGWVRINFNYFISPAVFEFLLRAVEFVADEGWKLLPLYRFEAQSGRWWHKDGPPKPAMSLTSISYASGRMEYGSRHATEPESALVSYLEKATQIVEQAVESYADLEVEPLTRGAEFEQLRWFSLPDEVAAEFRGEPAHTPPASRLLQSK
jgi:selenocysteine lyase/cysteine desulfurase